MTITLIRNNITRPSEKPTMSLLPCEFLGTCNTVGILSSSIILRTRQCSRRRKTRPEQARTVIMRLVCEMNGNCLINYVNILCESRHLHYVDIRHYNPQSYHHIDMCQTLCTLCNAYRRDFHKQSSHFRLRRGT
jgi:hypothetical protein